MAVSGGDLAERLREDFQFYAPNCLQITATTGQVVPFILKPAQVLVDDAAQAQVEAGRPVRLIVPKARKEGISTYATGKIVQRVTQRYNHNAFQVAQDTTTAGELLAMARMMHAHLPDPEGWDIKPPIANQRRRVELVFGNPARKAQVTGDVGLNSRLLVQSATEFEAGRGFTIHSLHGSEVAMWADAQRKLNSLFNAVPDDPSTFVILESTSDGYNHWRTLCMNALEGKNDFSIVFLPWFAEPQYVKRFIGAKYDEDGHCVQSSPEREEFIERIGTGEWGVDEPDLIETHGCTYEQLHWRRWAIANNCQGDLRLFHKEFPSTLDESFGATGRTVFNANHVAKARQAVQDMSAPAEGSFAAGSTLPWRTPSGTINIPQSPKWEPKPGGPWRIYSEPDPARSYVAAVDPAGDDVFDEKTAAMHACQIIDHETGEQVAEMEMQGDTDIAAEQIFLAITHYNKAWIAVEVSGGYGYGMNRRIHKDWRYPFVYRRKRVDSARMHDEEDRTGWDTNRATRSMLFEGGVELLREGTHGLHSANVVHQLATMVRDARGKPVPATNERSDLVMAWLISQHIRGQLPRKRAAASSGTVNTTTRGMSVTRRAW